jgi:phosphatidylinositol-4,5-bisphosphate 3-kinase
MIFKIYDLISTWTCLKPVIAIELLNCKYFDIEVRNFAVRCLDKYMKDEEIQSYLLQLVQV